MNLKQFGVLLSVSTILGMNVIANKALAEDPSITFGEAIVSSGGCVIDRQLVGTDGRTLSLIFDNFSALDGERERCILRVNTLIPSGLHVQNVQIQYLGSTQVGPSSKGTSLSRTYTFIADGSSSLTYPSKTTRFTDDVDLFSEQDEITVLSDSCGGEGQLGLNIIAQSSVGSSIFVDSADFNTGDVVLHFDLSPCT